MRSMFAPTLAADPTWLRGRTLPWGLVGWVALAAALIAGTWLRCADLAAEGFADDEVHKWLAANRYLAGDFGGDDLEHPMVMKALIAASIAVLPRSWQPEALTRLPSALAGAILVLAIALLGRRLFGRTTGLVSAVLASVSVTLVGYNRIAKEDTIFTLFLVLLVWCLAEAHAAAEDGRTADTRRWEAAGAVFTGLMLATKYFLFHALIPLFAYAALRAGGSRWTVPPRRWAALIILAFCTFAAANFEFFRSSSWSYLASYLREDPIGDRWTSESLWFMGRLYWNFGFRYRGGLPWWFHLVFAAVKLAPVTLLLVCAGFGLAVWERRPAHRVLIVWIVTWFAIFVVGVAKFGRFFLSVMPACLLLASHAAVVLAGRLGWTEATRLSQESPRPRSSRFGQAALTIVLAALVVPEAWAAVAHAPHYRLYVSPLGGGDARVPHFFPHCDFYDAGVREAMAVIAERAEAAAEVTSEVEWPVRYYAERGGRGDLATTQLRREKACLQDRVCYVVVQVGRTYFHHEAAIAALSRRAPWYEQQVGRYSVVKVYRLDRDQRPFP